MKCIDVKKDPDEKTKKSPPQAMFTTYDNIYNNLNQKLCFDLPESITNLKKNNNTKLRLSLCVNTSRIILNDTCDSFAYIKIICECKNSQENVYDHISIFKISVPRGIGSELSMCTNFDIPLPVSNHIFIKSEGSDITKIAEVSSELTICCVV